MKKVLLSVFLILIFVISASLIAFYIFINNKIIIDGKIFTLKYSNCEKNSIECVNDYYLKNEDSDNWTETFSMLYAKDIYSPMEAAQIMTEGNPYSKIYTNDKKGSVMVLSAKFLKKENEGPNLYAKQDVANIMKYKYGDAVVAQKYSKIVHLSNKSDLDEGGKAKLQIFNNKYPDIIVNMPAKRMYMKPFEYGQKNTKNEDYYFQKAEAEYQNGNYKVAIENLDKAIKIKPNAEYYFYRGYVKEHILEFGDRNSAIEDYTKAIELAPDKAMPYYNRGLQRQHMKEYKGSLEDFDKYITMAPYDTDAYKNRALTKEYLNDYKGALEDYNKAIEINPNEWGTWHNRGLLKLEMGNKKGAKEDLQKAILLEPNDTVAAQKLDELSK